MKRGWNLNKDEHLAALKDELELCLTLQGKSKKIAAQIATESDMDKVKKLQTQYRLSLRSTKDFLVSKLERMKRDWFVITDGKRTVFADTEEQAQATWDKGTSKIKGECCTDLERKPPDLFGMIIERCNTCGKRYLGEA